jgi:hypothetical protein
MRELSATSVGLRVGHAGLVAAGARGFSALVDCWRDMRRDVRAQRWH